MTTKGEPGKPSKLPKAPPAREGTGSAGTGPASTGAVSTVSGGTGPPERPDPPRTVRIAVLLMYAGAAVTAIGLVLSVVVVATGDKALRASHPQATLAQLHATKNALIIVAVVSAAIEIAAWLLLARTNRLGLRWARIAATVLFALNTVNMAGHLRGGATVGNTIYSVLLWLIGLATIVLLWLRESGAYFAASSARPPRAAGRS